MKATLRTLLIGSVALLAAPQMSNAFSLRSVIDDATATSQSVRPPVAVGTKDRNVILAQAGDATVRIGQLEEEVRKLNGKLEDLGYQMLQMQEQMRQMQKDNEFRFQRLEGGSGGGGSATTTGSDHTENTTAPVPDVDLSKGALPGVSPSTTASTSSDGLGAPPRPLGTMSVGENGKPVGSTMEPPRGNYDGTRTAALPPQASSPEDIYRNSYDLLLKGRYKQAEQGFKDYLDILPDGAKAADANFWLGESEFSQGKFNEAAKTFLDAHQKYPKADKAPETLLKLGMSLAALDNHDTACATYREVLKRYPNASPSVRKKVASEQDRAGC